MVPYDHLREGRSWSVIGQIKPAAVWRLYANVSGLFISGLLFALVLAGVTAGTGSVFVVDGPATSPKIEIRDGVPTLPVKIGDKLEFDMNFHVQEGGCQRIMTRTFTRADPENPYQLSVRKPAPAHAVGRPGAEHVAVDLPPGISPGLWHYKSTADAVCPQLGRMPPSVDFVTLDVEVVDPDGPVVKPLTPPKLADYMVRAGGPLVYTQSWERFDDTRSDIYMTYTPMNRPAGEKVEAIVERIPALQRPPGKSIDVTLSLPMPKSVTTGRWRVRQTLISTRPGGRTRIDPQFDIQVEVVE